MCGESSLISNTGKSSKTHYQDNSKISKTMVPSKETARLDNYHDCNSKEGIAHILKGTLITGVANISPQAAKSHDKSPNMSLIARNRSRHLENSSKKVSVLRLLCSIELPIYL